MSHTHELRKTTHKLAIGGIKYTSTVLVKGSNQECYEYLGKIAEEYKCGIGLLLNNGGYSVVDLDLEKIKRICDSGVQLLESLGEMYLLSLAMADKHKDDLGWDVRAKAVRLIKDLS